jgi:molybdopterin converting factor subunit 1
MRVSVQLFARLRELCGRAEWTCEVTADATVADVWRALVDAFPPAAALKSSVSSAVNAEFASMSTRVGDGDEVAFLPPVSGGAPADR